MSPNYIGTYTLCKREIWRFAKVWNQTVVAPLVTTLLFLAIMTLAMGSNTGRMIDGIAFNRFIAPGLIMMAIVQNAFANTSSSLMLAKIQGVIIDILMPPLTGGEVVFAYVIGGVVRGALVGVAVMTAVYLFVPFTLYHIWIGLFYVVSASDHAGVAWRADRHMVAVVRPAFSHHQLHYHAAGLPLRHVLFDQATAWDFLRNLPFQPIFLYD